VNEMTVSPQIKDLLERLLKDFPHRPTPGQVACLTRIAGFLEKSSAGDTYVLRGYAGTGKTTIISTLVSSLKQIGTKTVLLAPTGRAAKVVSAYSRKAAFTIHRRIYRTKIKDGVYAGFALNRNSSSDTLFIVDESSMVTEGSSGVNGKKFNGNLLADLITYVRSGKNCRMILVGDTAQLPPVGEDDSPALDARRLMDLYDIRTGTYELTEVVRQEKESGILYNATAIRNSLRINEKCPLMDTGFEDFKTVNAYDLPEILLDSYKNLGADEVIVICRSNKAAGNYNRQIRYQSLFFEDEINVGDRVMCVKNNYFWIDQDATAGFIANGDILSITAIRSINEKYGYRFAELTLGFIDQPDQPGFEATVVLDSIYANGPALSHDDNQKLFHAVLESLPKKLKTAERKSLLASNPYVNALQIKFAYAVTCHKAQGGQWKNVLIDRGFIHADEENSKNNLRWLYTAVTRATEQVNLIGFHESEIK
jgi:AAA domain/UvrD-like helicase C-terminal domain